MDGLIAMKKTIILLAGYPGTGKSYLAETIRQQFPVFQLLSPDEIKEEFWDAYGFDTPEEKEALIQQSWQEYYRRMERAFAAGKQLLSDYPFSQKQKAYLLAITQKYDYQILTICLTGDLDVLFQRQQQRDLSDTRHLGHIMQAYHKDKTKISHREADNLLSYDEFIRRCTTRGYGTFSLGKTINIDVTDFAKINYSDILYWISDKIH